MRSQIENKTEPKPQRQLDTDTGRHTPTHTRTRTLLHTPTCVIIIIKDVKFKLSRRQFVPSCCCCCCSLCALSICATIWKIFDKNKIKLDILPRRCHRAAPCRIDLSNNYETRGKKRLSSKADYVIMSAGEMIVKYQIYIWIYLNIECQILPRALLYIDIFSFAIKIPACRRVCFQN